MTMAASFDTISILYPSHDHYMIARNRVLPEVGSYILQVGAYMFGHINRQKIKSTFSVYSLLHFQNLETAQS